VAQGGRLIDVLAAAAMIADAQDAVARTLGAMLRSGRLPSTLMFTGPDGAGKELMAVWLAARLNCTDTENPCGGACASCAKLRHLEHPDVHLIHPVPYRELEKSLPVVIASRREDFFARGEFGNQARSIGIDIVRRIIEATSKLPFEGRRSVVIVSEAHLMTSEAQNAFLKLLEEPPTSTVIILVTEHPDSFLPTVLSRCQQIRFGGLSGDSVARFLETFYSVERGEARRLASMAGGNVRRSIKLLDERFITLRGDAASLLGLVFDRKAKELLGEAEALSRRYTREELVELLEEMTLILSAAMRGEEVPVGTDSTGKVMEGRDIPNDLGRINRAVEHLRRNVDAELTLSQLLLDLANRWY
jgi:DNA polymerase-3 subunit delta'